MVGQGNPQPQPPSPQAASAPPFFFPPATVFFGVALTGAGAAAVVLAGVVAGAATAAVVAGAAFVADAASPDVVDSVAGLASVLASVADVSSFLAPQAPFAAQLDLAPLPSPPGTSVAGELAWLPAHALSTAPEPMTANAAANLFIFMMIFSLWLLAVRWSPSRQRDDCCPLRINIAVVST